MTGMFARYFIELPLPPRDVVSALDGTPGSWLPALATDATFQGDELLAEVGFGETVRVARQVAIELGAPVATSSKTVIPLRWTAAGSRGLFPELDADLEIAPLGTARTQLAISARYVPPLGAIGRVLDRAALSRVAEATVKDFLDRVGERIVAGSAAAQTNVRAR
jgi:hypothetical protein